MSDEIERGIRDWIGQHDRPIPVGDAVAAPSSRWPAWLPMPVAVAGAMVIVLLAAGVVLAGGGDSPEGDVETASPSSSTSTTDAPPTTTSTASTTTTSVASSTSTSTTSAAVTTTRPPAPPPGPPAPGSFDGQDQPGCEELESSYSWAETGSDGELSAAAGSRAALDLHTTNRGDEPCVDNGPPCVGPGLLEADGTPRDRFESVGCAAIGIHRELAPGESRTDRVRVTFDAPPGRYLVDLRLPDGQRPTVPVRLDDRIPACALDGVTVRPNGNAPGSSAFTVIADSGEFGLIVEPVPAGCTIRVTGVVLEIDTDDATHAYSDADDHWLQPDPGHGVLPHVRVGQVQEPAAGDTTYPARVTVQMEGGSVSYSGEVVVR